MQVLDEEREARLAGVSGARVGHRTRRRGPEERAVIRAAVVVAGHPEGERERDDEDRGREIPVATDERQRRMHAVRAEAGRIERREVRLVVIVRADDSRVDRVQNEGAEGHHDHDRFDPPKVAAFVRSTPDLDRRRPCHHTRWWAYPSQNAKVSMRSSR